jgi:hypothetical protein
MNRTTKIVLDIALGAVIPILILTYLSEPLGNVRAYIFASLVPVGWVMLDLFAITRRFNFITSYMGLFAVVNGLLTFWFVDGLLYAFKDSVSFILTVTLFGGSILLSRPFIQYFVIQGLNPDTSERTQALQRLLHEPDIYRAIVRSSLLFAGINLLTGTTNFLLNLHMVTAPFGTDTFNLQVAQVNAITRIALNIPETLGMVAAVWLIIFQMYRHLPSEEGKHKSESEFWDLLQLREQPRLQPNPAEVTC